MSTPLAITACRLLTPLDSAHYCTWSAIHHHHRVEKDTTVAEEFLDPDTSLDRSIRLALAVAKPLAADPTNLSLFCGTSKGPITTLLKMLENPAAITPAQASHLELGVGAMGAILRDRLKIPGPAHTSVAACSSGLHALHRAAAAIRQGDCTRALVVAADASLHPLFQASFEHLGVIAPRDTKGFLRCRPFSIDGRGFFLIEAAAALLLEANPQNPPLAYLEDSWIGADSTALIATDPHAHSLRTGLRAMQTPEPPAFIHAHATGTSHDAYELAAIHSIYGNKLPVFSHKKYLGHSLGAAGLLSATLSILCHYHAETLDGKKIPAQSSSLTLAQGFGGHIAIARIRGATPSP